MAERSRAKCWDRSDKAPAAEAESNGEMNEKTKAMDSGREGVQGFTWRLGLATAGLVDLDRAMASKSDEVEDNGQ